jgi:hypothetical protein
VIDAAQWALVGTLLTCFIGATAGLIATLLRSIDLRISESFDAKDALLADYRMEIERLKADIQQCRVELAEARVRIAELEKGH